MKIKSLEIRSIRGIKEIKVAPQGGSMVVYGPNGTGKSAIVDAVDFLLTGEITRLTGEGTEGLTLKDHGCHVDAREDLKNTSVNAVVEIDGKDVTLFRSIHNPRSLSVTPRTSKQDAEDHLEVARLGQHILSRRQILNYICAKGGERAKRIQELLNLSQVENIRTTLVSVQSDAAKEHKQAESLYVRTESEIKSLLSVSECATSTLLEETNTLRKKLKAEAIDEEELWSGKLKDGIKPLYEVDKEHLSMEQIGNYIKQVRDFLEGRESVFSSEENLSDFLKKILEDENHKQQSAYLRLLEVGFSLAGEKNVCPLCDREWDKGDFKEYLSGKQQTVEVSLKQQKEIDALSKDLKIQVDSLKVWYEKLFSAHAQLGVSAISEEEKEQFLGRCEAWSLALDDPLKALEEKKWPEIELKALLDADALEKHLLCPLEEAIAKGGTVLSEQQAAWDTLTKLEDVVKRFQGDSKEKERRVRAKERADFALDQFVRSRDETLEAIYDDIKGKFEDYYRVIHSEDENAFTSRLTPDGAALHLEVDFYNRGHFPPHALHSEGHQDSMGLCLFFALNEYLTKNIIKVVVLDDTVMSIDKDHRRAICKLLKETFPDRQFIITTHDAAWARQLRTDGVVTKQNMIHFVNWNIDTGPVYELEKDLWERIQEDLDRDDVPAAAARLRRNAESFFEEACDLLGASIPYRGDHQWGLGEYATGATSSLKKYLKKAKAHAQSNGQDEKHKELCAFDEKAKAVIEQSQVEQWAVNANVHFNKWADMGKRDFVPVSEAFKNLFALFACSSCGQPLAIGEYREGSRVVSCACGKVFLNL